MILISVGQKYVLVILAIATSKIETSEPDKVCPKASFGVYPDCYCNYAEFNATTNACENFQCPELSGGIYPKCSCHENHTVYKVEFNDCLYFCPPECTGYWPNCVC